MSRKRWKDKIVPHDPNDLTGVLTSEIKIDFPMEHRENHLTFKIAGVSPATSAALDVITPPNFIKIIKYNNSMDSFKFIEGVYAYYVICTVVDWLPILKNPEPVKIIIDSLLFCIRSKFLRIYAYVIMPNHLHMIVFDGEFDNKRLQKTLAELRKFTGHKLADYVDNHLAASFSKAIRSNSLNDRSRQVWLPGWHAEGLVSEAFLYQKANYIHENPVRKGYVREPENWRYSSAEFWINGIEGEIPISMVIEEGK